VNRSNKKNSSTKDSATNQFTTLTFLFSKKIQSTSIQQKTTCASGSNKDTALIVVGQKKKKQAEGKRTTGIRKI
jgi:hypothetical protein